MVSKERIALYIRCPGEGCDPKPRNWFHVKCGTKVYIDENADLYCGGHLFSCEHSTTRYIMNWSFKCDKDSIHKGQYFKFTPEALSFAVASVTSIVQNIAGLTPREKMILKKIYLKMSARILIDIGAEVDKIPDQDLIAL